MMGMRFASTTRDTPSLATNCMWWLEGNVTGPKRPQPAMEYGGIFPL